MIDSKAKGIRGELKVRDTLRELTKLKWERTPGSGMYSQSHGLKGDLYIPGSKNNYTVEVKSYEEDHLTSKILHNTSNKLLEWWEQTTRQAIQNNNIPLLIFKYDRSKLFAAFQPTILERSDLYNIIKIFIKPHTFVVSLLEDFIEYEKPKFIE